MPEALAGVLLQDFLAHVHPAVDRAVLRGIQARGAIRVNGMPAARNLRLRAFDYLELDAEPGELAARPARSVGVALPVLFESSTTLVVDKPAGLTTVPDRTGSETGVHGLLPALRPGQDLRIVHRLDRNTSGCLILAKGLAAAQHFDVAFRGQHVHKRYVALVHGAFGPNQRTVDWWLGPDPRRRGKTLASPTEREGFRPARTTIAAVQALDGCTLLHLWPESGRSHQLRAHLAAIGFPIAGDGDYGGRPLLLSEHKRGYKLRRGVQEAPMLRRLFLHAAHVEFRDVDGTAVAVDAPLAADLQSALDRLIAVQHGGTRSN